LNEALQLTFCMLLRNLASSDLGRQVFSRNLQLRLRVRNWLKDLISVQDCVKMSDIWSPVSSPSRNTLLAEACACMWKLVQPYEPDDNKAQRLAHEEMERVNKDKKKAKKNTEPFVKYVEAAFLEDVVYSCVSTGNKFDFTEQLKLLIDAHLDSEYCDSSNEVVEKACGLLMALASADKAIEDMNEREKVLELKGPADTVAETELLLIRKIRPSQPGAKKKAKFNIRKHMGQDMEFIRVLCDVLVKRNRSKPVVEKAAGALCVLLTESDNLGEFQANKDALESFLSMQITSQEVKLGNLVNRLQAFALG